TSEFVSKAPFPLAPVPQAHPAALPWPRAFLHGETATRATVAPDRSGVDTSPLLSYWMGGYEGADHINGTGVPLDLCEITQHGSQITADYVGLAEFGIRTVRESAGWRLIDRGGKYDFGSLRSRAVAAQTLGLQVVWTLCHYGWPEELDLLSPLFVE